MLPLVVDLHAGHGNLLFEYAAGLTVANMTGRTAVFSERDEGSRERLIRYLDADVPIASLPQEIAAGGPPPRRSILRRGIGRVSRKVLPSDSILRGDFGAMPPKVQLRRLRRFSGFGQHTSYVLPSLGAVLPRIAARFEGRLGHDFRDVAIIDFRRGGYIPLGFELPLTYYESVIASHLDQWQGRVGVVSDDALVVEIYEEELRRRGFEVVEIRDEGKPVREEEAFCAMASAALHVMANSTFSWWAAAVGDHVWDGPEPRRVIYPGGWLAGRDVDLKLDSWTEVRAW